MDMEIDKKKYADYIKAITPVHNLWISMGKAFITGGLICTLGQFIMNWATDRCGLEAEAAGTWTSIILVFLSALCTGLNIYQKLVKFGGAGALVPITGFANSVAAPAIEYKTEGQVNRIPLRRPGFRYWRKDIYHCRTGDPVWRGSKLDLRSGILGFTENVSFW